MVASGIADIDAIEETQISMEELYYPHETYIIININFNNKKHNSREMSSRI